MIAKPIAPSYRETYRMLGLRAAVKMERSLEVGGTLVEGAEFCPLEVQYWML